MPAPAPPEVVDAALFAVAEGRSRAEAGRIAGVSRTAVGDWLTRWRDRAERCSALARSVWTRNVLRSADEVSRALIRDATSQERDDKGRPLIRGADRAQCARALWEPLRGPESLTIVGDVDASVNVSVDARKVQVLQASRGAELDAHIAELSKGLGLDL